MPLALLSTTTTTTNITTNTDSCWIPLIISNNYTSYKQNVADKRAAALTGNPFVIGKFMLNITMRARNRVAVCTGLERSHNTLPAVHTASSSSSSAAAAAAAAASAAHCTVRPTTNYKYFSTLADAAGRYLCTTAAKWLQETAFQHHYWSYVFMYHFQLVQDHTNVSKHMPYIRQETAASLQKTTSSPARTLLWVLFSAMHQSRTKHFYPLLLRKPCKLIASVAQVCSRQLAFLVQHNYMIAKWAMTNNYRQTAVIWMTE